MDSYEKFRELSLKEGALLVYEKEILPLVIACRAESIAKERNLPPSAFLKPSLISLDIYDAVSYTHLTLPTKRIV